MEKRRPTYNLAAVQAAIGQPGRLAITVSALRDATSLGFDRSGIVGVLGTIRPGMFVKSMTTFADHRVWQDVYYVPSDRLVLNVKFQADVITEFRVISFKEK